MGLFVDFVTRLIPIYLLIGAGYLIGKRLPVNREAISSLLIYLVAPVVIFNSVYTTRLTRQTILLPIIFFVLCTVMALTSYFVHKNIEPRGLRGLLAFAAGSGNTGYFGIPVALVLFGEKAVGLVVLCVLGFLVYETTIGFFLMARGTHTFRESIGKLIRLPVLYAFLLGMSVQLLSIKLGSVYEGFVPNFRGAYVLLGSLLIGIALSEFTRAHASLSVVLRSFAVKFVAWPLIIVGLIMLDQHQLHIFVGREDIYQVMFLISVVPLAANTVAYASFLKAEPERAAFIVFTSTVFAIIYIPVMMSIVLPRLV